MPTRRIRRSRSADIERHSAARGGDEFTVGPDQETVSVSTTSM
ncbi:hypothetical protein ABZS93_27450 [Streptomyces sp900116325]